jgi:AhpD family alkylhydroperoxidase
MSHRRGVARHQDMQARIKNPAALISDAMPPLVALGKIISSDLIPAATRELVHLRVSQINGCAVCIDMHVGKMSDTPQRLATVAVWQDAPFFTEPERAALALAEAMTRLADQPERVPDHVWNEAARHYDEKQLAALVLAIAVINMYNRVNVATRQVAGARSW